MRKKSCLSLISETCRLTNDKRVAKSKEIFLFYITLGYSDTQRRGSRSDVALIELSVPETQGLSERIS